MSRNRRKSGKRRWRRRRALRRLALAAAALALAVAGVWLLARGDGGSKQYLREPAPAFTLPTIAGDEVSISGHLGRHALLLYFNEGMG